MSMRALMAGAVAVLALVVGGCGGEQSASEQGGGNLSVATGGTGGVYAVYGGGLADAISKNLEDYKATAETTSASVDNIKLIAAGDSDIAFSLADSAVDAAEPRRPSRDLKPIRALARSTRTTPVGNDRRQGNRIGSRTWERGLSVGDPGSGTEIIALRVLEAAAPRPRHDIKRSQLVGVDSRWPR